MSVPGYKPPLAKFTVDELRVEIYASRQAMGLAAASHAIQALSAHSSGVIRAIFGAAPSQNELLANLVQNGGAVDWQRVEAFHLDEYIGLDSEAPQTFRNFLTTRLFERLPFGAVHYLDGSAANLEAETQRYSQLLANAPLDLACIGIGENGHIAFNDPPQADFNDPQLVRIIELDHTSRVQQVNDGCFERLDDVPRRALTVTIPPIMFAREIVCVVPGPTKAQAVYTTLTDPVSPACPASILRTHSGTTLYLDQDSAARLKY